MRDLARHGGILAIDAVSLETIAGRFGTPLYVYSAATLLERYRALDHAFAGRSHRILYSVKANSTGALLSLLAREGCGADVVSAGEMARAIRAGIPPDRIVFAGAGKRDDELAAALEAGIALINVESAGEFSRLMELADRRRGSKDSPRVPIAFRITPDVVGGTHRYTETGTHGTKFGMVLDEALSLVPRAIETASPLELVGLHVHFGSQITAIDPFVESARRLREMVGAFRAAGAPIREVNVGGGLGISYAGEAPPTPADLAAAVRPLFDDLGVDLLLEPGRSIVGPAGLLLTKVLDIKDHGVERFVVVDAAMNDLIRPSLYGAHHEIVPVREREGAPRVVDVVGPICESGDFLARARSLPPVEPGDRLVVRDAGAYGFSMASNYNSRPRAAEVLIEDGVARLIRRRETLADLLATEID